MDLNGKAAIASVNGESISDFENHILKDREQIDMNITSNK